MKGTCDGFRFAEVLSQELAQLRPPQAAPADQKSPSDEAEAGVWQRAREADLVGLAFSGGGIRSATFNLGFLQGLAKSWPGNAMTSDGEGKGASVGSIGLLPFFDYLSTVSGGGYIGSWFTAWLHREKKDNRDLRDLEQRLTTHPCSVDGVEADDAECSSISGIEQPRTSGFPPLEHAAIRHLRRYSNYLTPRLGISGDLLAVISLFLRNLVVLQLCLIVLVVAVLMLPYLLTSVTVLVIDSEVSLTSLGGILLAAGFVLLIACMGIWTWQFKDLPAPPDKDADLSTWRRQRRRQQKATNLWLGVTVALLPFIFWMMITGLAPILIAHYWVDKAMPLYFVLLYAAAYLLAWTCSPGPVAPSAQAGEEARSRTTKRILIALLAALVFGYMMHFASVWLDVGHFEAAGKNAFVSAIGAPVVLLVLSFTIALQLGLGGSLYQERERERWARVGGLILLAAGVWTLVFACSLYAPPLVKWLGKGGFAILLGWAGTSGIGAWLARNVLTSDGDVPSRVKAVAMRALPWFFLAGLAIFLAYALSTLVIAVTMGYQVGAFKLNLPAGVSIAVWYDIYPLLFESVAIPDAAILFVLATATFVVLSWRLDLNAFSAHAIYRNRLVRAYLGASRLRRRNPHPISGLDPDDDVPLEALTGQRPVPIINTTINMTGGDDLAWQTRRAASFTFTPTFVGFEGKSSSGVDLGGYRQVADYARYEVAITRVKQDGFSHGRAAGISLGTAMAVSGAAASPNMGRFTSTALSALMTVFNLRTGFWAGNPQLTEVRGSDADSEASSRKLWHFLPPWRRKRPVLSTWPLLAELAGSANAESDWINLSDGGHFENLGIYELIRRRCRFIVVVDAGCDPEHQFTDLANAVRKCWTDFGVHIHFPQLDDVRKIDERLSKEHGCLGLIRYPECNASGASATAQGSASYGLILYVKCSLTKHEMSDYADIRQYAETHESYPHEPTSDQFFDEEQFEAYRHLGFCVADWSRARIEEFVKSDGSGLRPGVVAEWMKASGS